MVIKSKPSASPLVQPSQRVPAAPPGLLPSLTGLRFIAAFTILMPHVLSYNPDAPELPAMVQYLVGSSAIGMPLFFVLSGFVIHYAYGTLFSRGEPGRAIVGFLIARFARIYPAYILSVLIFSVGITYGRAVYRDPGGVANAIYLAAMAHQWTYRLLANGDMMINHANGILWSVSTEWGFYLAYPLIFGLVSRLTDARRLGLGILLYCAAVYGLLFVLNTAWPTAELWLAGHFDHLVRASDDFGNSAYRWLFYMSPYVRIFEFGLGCLVAQLFMLDRHRPAGSREILLAKILCGLSIVVVLAYVKFIEIAPAHSFIWFLHMNFGLAPFLAAIIFFVIRYESRLAQWLSSRPVTLCGDASYSLYVFHPLFVGVLFSRWRVPFDDAHLSAWWLRDIATMALCIVLSIVLYRWFESPARKFLRQRLGARLLPQRRAA